MFREKLEKSKIITIAICFFGAVLVANLIGAGDIRLDGIGILAGVINGIGVALQILLPKFFAKDYDRDTLLVYGFLGAAFVLAFGMDFSSVAMHIEILRLSIYSGICLESESYVRWLQM